MSALVPELAHLNRFIAKGSGRDFKFTKGAKMSAAWCVPLKCAR